MKKFAITDIHGCYLSFEALLEKIAFTSADELYLLGDYIDRGPSSREVLDKIIELREAGYTVHVLAGNHDYAMLDAKSEPGFFRDWKEGWGGKQTMDSFEAKSLEEVPWKYWDLISEMEIVMEVDGYILVHAGINTAAKKPLSPDVDMLYLRNWYDEIKHDWLDGRIIVHGHTPIPISMAEYMLSNIEKQGYIDIDTGCFAKHRPGQGFLTAFDLTNRELHFQPCLDNVDEYWKGHDW